MKYIAIYNDNEYVRELDDFKNNLPYSHFTSFYKERALIFSLKYYKLLCTYWNSDDRHDYPTLIIPKEF